MVLLHTFLYVYQRVATIHGPSSWLYGTPMAAARAAPSAPRVVIIGAGVAGLSAASCLKDAKCWSKSLNEAPEAQRRKVSFKKITLW